MSRSNYEIDSYALKKNEIAGLKSHLKMTDSEISAVLW